YSRHQRSHRIGQVLMLGVDCDRHWSPSFGLPGAYGSSTPNLITGGLVDYMGQPLAVPQPAAVGDGFDQITPHGVDGVPGDVRGAVDDKDRDPARGQPAVTKRIDQGVFVDDRAA